MMNYIVCTRIMYRTQYRKFFIRILFGVDGDKTDKILILL